MEPVKCTKEDCTVEYDHAHNEEGRTLFPCSWHPGEYHNICSEACN